MKQLILALTLMLSVSGFAQKEKETATINAFLDDWHKAAAAANGEVYFGSMTPDAIYIGTDATENWTLDQFKAFAKPYFDRGKAWDFKPIERHIYFSADGKTAWFDELLDTWMKICRGSGVLVKQKDGSWKIAHYVLSATIPNDDIDAVIKVKAAKEESQLKEIRK